jgi:HEAT repeat protein
MRYSMDEPVKIILDNDTQSLKALLSNLSNENGLVRKNARELLVKFGEKAIGFLGELIRSPKHITRWEAIKTLGQMRNSISIPYLLDALEDESDDIRWLAAEALVSMDGEVVVPLLKTLIERYPYVYTRESVYHILKMLSEKDQFIGSSPDLGRLMNILLHHKDESEIPPAAMAALDAWRSNPPGVYRSH